jgi:archaeosine synthase
MPELGRTVIARQRMARLWALGDRSAPVSFTPGLVLLDGDLEREVSLAPFSCQTDSALPSTMTISGRAGLDPFQSDVNSPQYSASIGHVLPPSLDEADAGEKADSGDLLPVSWQRIRHDHDLLAKDLKPAIIVLVDAPQLARRPGRLIEAITLLKRRFPGALMWTPGLSGPDNLAPLTWFGVDLHDQVRSRQCAASGYVLTASGPRKLEESGEPDADHWAIAIAEVRRAIRDSSLRELADRQALTSPRLVEHMRRYDALMAESSDHLSQIVDKGVLFNCHSEAAQRDPLVRNWQSFMRDEYQSPSGMDDVLILLPCSDRKPYSSSRSHKRFFRAISHNGCHELMITSPLAVVPRDLENIWPAGMYDIPVTGDWSRDEVSVIHEVLAGILARNKYRVIINHSGMDLSILGKEIIDTRIGDRATGEAALSRLSAACKENISRGRRRGEQVNMDNLRSVARYHHLNDNWLDDCRIKGRYPRWKVEKDGKQLAMWSPERAGFSISKTGVEHLHQHNSLARIDLTEDFKLKGDLHIGIMKAWDKSLQKGSDVLLMQSSQLVGSARCLAPSWEWDGTPGRLLKLHHKL